MLRLSSLRSAARTSTAGGAVARTGPVRKGLARACLARAGLVRTGLVRACFGRAGLVCAALGSAALPVAAETDAGAYLAARHAAAYSDYGQAIEFFARAMAEDPGNVNLLDTAIISHIAAGNIPGAVELSQRLMQTGARSEVASLVLLGEAAQEGRWQDALDGLDAGLSVSALFDDLMRGWALIGADEPGAAMDTFDAIATREGVEPFGLYHKALALAADGDFAAADDILSDEDRGGLRLTRRGVVAHAQILSQLDRNADALALIDEYFGGSPDDAIEAVIDRLAAGETLEFDIVRQPSDGVAEIYHTIANALSGSDAEQTYTILYSRMTAYLRPGHTEAILLTAALLESLERYDLAIEVLRRIPRDDPAFAAAELGRAEALRASGKVDAAVEVMRQLTELDPGNPMIEVTLGDTLRAEERFDEAAQAYDRAIASFDEPEEGQWIVYFARGIARERTERWGQAEADFRKALELRPGQPQVLNYLGYSYVEKGEQLDEALDMIEQAVAARPDSGHITDSLGWAFYRLGRYDEAVAPMERAVELMPIDPVVNDHLGDVYWAVGRTLEAEFQWRRALSFVDNTESGEVDADRIRRKLDVGLDAVLREEGGAPLSVANGG
ncbi:tetratricopeptide repeat protein [Mesobaculum littorinae]|uniref:Tetratricopeptide repeat protein n=1 Tax=Mesobaculum littorinae TaxID=2486419 RepID=A0A438AGG7_9RHOB|nr:tetratricopeptide repeat protein [Mesobaculum littorinae]RVV97801.1 tetratricopeptide repeat protein [Mesobaculum littorinae]